MNAGCRCERPKTAEIPTGELVCTWCPEWRHHCEVRHVANIATPAGRNSYIEGVTARRGAKAGKALAEAAFALRDSKPSRKRDKGLPRPAPSLL